MSELKELYWNVCLKLVVWSFQHGLDDLADWIGDVSGLRSRLDQLTRSFRLQELTRRQP